MDVDFYYPCPFHWWHLVHCFNVPTQRKVRNELSIRQLNPTTRFDVETSALQAGKAAWFRY